MKPRISMITLGVSDLARPIRFYEEGLGLPRKPMDADVAFFTLNGTWLALYSRAALAEDAAVPADGSGFERLVKPAQDVFLGGYSGYFADPDGHLWEVAWNPHFAVGPQDQ